jgi:pimeloyl-ACP methyl ester carboxylesterase
VNTVLARHGSAVSVVLATLGLASARPRRAPGETAALRRSVHVAGLGIALNVLVAGDPAGPRIVLVHGTPGAADGWADYLLAAPPGVELVALDRPGFGRSGAGHALPRLADQAAAVAALLPDDGRRAVLVGHSLGGAVVARVAAEHPQRVAALVLLAASLDPALERIHPLQRVGDWPPLRALLPRAIRHANAELLALRAELAGLQALLPRIAAPVCIVHGTADPLVPVANVDYLHARLGAARCRETVLIPGGNHFLPWNAPREVRAALHWALHA